MTHECDIAFYHAPQSRGMVVHWMLEELGCPYRMELINLKQGEQKSPAYLAINPMGKVPALVHGDGVVTETPAICCYLADTFPDAGLAMPVGHPQRGPYIKWLFFGPGTLEPAIIDRMFQRDGAPPETLGYGDFDAVLDMLCKALEMSPYLLGEHFTAADVVVGSGLHWGTVTGTVPERPEIAAYLERLTQRPALQRVLAKDRELTALLTG